MRKYPAHTKINTLFVLLLALLPAIMFAQEPADEPYLDTTIISAQAVEDRQPLFNVMSDSSSISARSIPDSIVKKMRADDDYWYAQTAPAREQQKPIEAKQEERWYQKDWFAKLLWFLVVASFVAIIIWFLASSNIRLFHRRSKSIDDDTAELTEETIFALPYEKEIKNAIASQNYRLATRLWYLRTLKDLAENNMIEYKQEKTDREYVNELYKTPYYKSFFQLTRNFEYAWYGKFDPSQEAFDLLQKDFIHFKQQLQ